MPIARNSKGQFAGGAVSGRAFTAGSLLKGRVKRNGLAAQLRVARDTFPGDTLRPTGRLGAIQAANRFLLGRLRAADRLKSIHTEGVKAGVLNRLGYIPTGRGR